MARLTDYVQRDYFNYGPQRYFISRWGFVFKFKGHVAIYHSLTIFIVLLTNDEFSDLIAYCNNHKNITQLPKWIDELIDAQIISVHCDNDRLLVENLRKCIPLPCVSIMQLILTDACNLACSYCYLGRKLHNLGIESELSNTHLMSNSVAEAAVDYFETQINYFPEYAQYTKDIIFYGGEPLLNFPVLKSVVKRIRKDQKKGIISQSVTFTVISNGTLLTPEIARFLKDENVKLSLSLDGVDKKANSSRVDKIGRPAYERILYAVNLATSMGLEYGLSITLTEHTIKQKKELIAFLLKYQIKGVSFNILLGKTKQGYNEDAAKFIVDFYRDAREEGIQEDRMLRKIKAFSQKRFYYHDCAALSGNQIVVMPNGGIGVCQGLIGQNRYLVSDVSRKNENFAELSSVLEWRRKTPINRNNCIKCVAIGICGGGCPVNAKNVTRNKSEIDKRFCVHTIASLEFLIEDICKVMIAPKEIL